MPERKSIRPPHATALENFKFISPLRSAAGRTSHSGNIATAAAHTSPIRHPRPVVSHPAPSRIVIATRESRLALWQARHVQARLQSIYPACEVELLGMTTRGDQILDRALSKVGGKGLFVKELEMALLDGRADLAVHSMKDVPADLDAQFTLAAIMAREQPFDALVSNRFARLEDLPPGAVVGTSSLRRESQLRARFPALRVVPLRGNLDTRLRKLDEGQYDAILLAAAGLIRLGLGERIRAVLPPEDSLPAAGQGALAIETLAARSDVAAWIAPLHHPDSAACVLAERAVTLALGGGCEVPMGVYGHIVDGQLDLRGFVALPDGSRFARAAVSGPLSTYQTLGLTLAEDLRIAGAEALLPPRTA